MREARITKVDRASVVAWPFAWALVYYTLTLSAVWGTEVHPIQAMLLMFGMMITAVTALAAAGIWRGLLRRRERQAAATVLRFREVAAFGAVSGAIPMVAVVGLYELLFIDILGAVTMLGLVASAGFAGALSSITTSGIVALRDRAYSRGSPPAGTDTTPTCGGGAGADR